MMKNVIFDFGRVLVRFEPDYMVGQYVADPEDAKILEEVIFDRLYWDKLDAGTITDEEVVSDVKKRIPERLWESAEKIYYNWIYNIPEIEGMREIITHIKEKGVSVYLLSNISKYFAEHSDEIPILKLLDGCVYSSVCGKVKPDKGIYEHLCSKYNILPEETLFVDDRKENIEGARKAGLSGYVFDGNAKALKEYLDIPLTTNK